MKYEPVKKHYNHPVIIEIGDFKPHKGKVICKQCKEFVKWANVDEIRIYKEMNK